MLPSSIFAIKLGKGALLKPHAVQLSQRQLNGVTIQQDPRELYGVVYAEKIPG